MVDSTPSITLTPTEERIFALLLEVVAENNLKTTLRVAGGWVRDKVLGKESDDIDLALDDISGKDFCLIVVAKLTQNGVKSDPFFTQANPAKGKFMEVASMKIEG
jgi:tRNA nucleotidyltransferase (CCA-adding enzyme)